MFIFVFLIVFIFLYIILSSVFSIKKSTYKNNLKKLSCCNQKHVTDHGHLTHQYHADVNATALVISCMDYNYVEATHDFLEKTKHAQKYDLISLAGASLGYNQNIFPWTSAVDDHIDLAVKLHGIKSIVIVDHMGCGMYEQIYNNGEKMTIEQEENFHRKNQVAAVATLKKKYPSLLVKTYLLR